VMEKVHLSVDPEIVLEDVIAIDGDHGESFIVDLDESHVLQLH
jgi:hypothetical protein